MSPLLKKKKGALTDKELLKMYCLYSAFISLGIMAVAMICHIIIPFYSETRTVLRMDLYHQYGPLFSELYDRIVNGQSLIYSWRSGLGSGFLGNFFNYCSSPFTLIILLFGHKNMPEAVAAMFILKAMLSSGTFTYYLNKTNNCVNKYSMIFGPMYAFCSYFVAYSWNIMWIDAMAVFPLVVLGIERIIQYKKPTLFIVTLTYTMITNYYMAYMVCILSVLYFLYYFFGRYELGAKLDESVIKVKKEKKYKKTGRDFIVVPEDENEETNIPENTENDDENIIAEASEEPTEETFSVEYSEAVDDVTSVLVDDIAADMPVITDSFESAGIPDDITTPYVVEAPEDGAIENISTEGESADDNAKPSKKKKGARNLRNNRFFATGCIFAFSAFLCFFLAAFALMPVSYCLNSSSATSASFPDEIKVYFNIFDFLSNHLPGTETTIRSSGDNVMPNVYCGLLTVMLVPLYFFTDRVSGRKKIAAVALLATFYFGFSINYFNFIWHGMHFPNDLPYRFSFAYSFILLTLAYKVILNIREFSKKTYIGIGMAIVLFVALITKLETPNNGSLSIWLSILFAIIYTVVFGLFYSPRYDKKNVVNLLIFTIVLELIFSDTMSFVMNQPKKNYVSDYDDYQSISEMVESDDSTLFYRTELTQLRARMDPCWYGYNGVSTFTSMASESTSAFMKKLGLFGNKINSYTYYPQTPIFNSLFGLKYIYDNNDMISEGDYYTKVGENDSFTAYEYKYVLPIAYAVNNDMESWSTTDSNPFEVQNSLLKGMTGVSDVMIDVPATDVDVDGGSSVSVDKVNSDTKFTVNKDDTTSTATVTVTITAETDGYYYTYAGCTKLDKLAVKADNGYSYEHNSTSIQPYILDIGYLEAGQEATVEYTVAKDNSSASITFEAAYLDSAKFEEAYNILKNQSLNYTEFDETTFTGTVTTTADRSVIFTTIPYDESWVVTVDGQELSYYDEENDTSKEGKIIKIAEGFIGIDVGEGEHTLTMTYKARGLTKGIAMTCGGIVVAVLLLVYKFYFSKKLEAKGKKPKIFENSVDIKD